MHATKQIYEKLKDRGYNTARGELYNVAKDLVAKSPSRSPYTALDGFVEAVQRRDELLVGFLRECALAYLMVIADDLSGAAVVKPAAAGGGRTGIDTQVPCVPAASTGIGGNAAALHHGTPSQTAEGGHPSIDTQKDSASPTSPRPWPPADVYVHDHFRAKPGFAEKPDIGILKPNRLIEHRPNRPHVPPEALFAAHMSTHLPDLSILDTLMVKNRPLGEVTVDEAREWAEQHRANGDAMVLRGRRLALEAAMVEALTHGLPGNVKVSRFADFFDKEEAARRLKAVESAHAA